MAKHHPAPSTKDYAALELGPLCVETINRTLGMELPPGSAHMSALAHRHAAEKHPLDYPVCHPLIALVIADPTFIGQSPRHRDNFEMVRRLPGSGGAVLVAVSVETDNKGRYRIRSFYVIAEAEVSARRAKRHLLLAQK
jgi:hypothetical protein